MLKLIVIIPPWGLSEPLDCFFVGEDEETDLYSLTKGEGQALEFTLTNYDCSNNFAHALASGKVLKGLKGYFKHKLHIKRE